MAGEVNYLAQALPSLISALAGLGGVWLGSSAAGRREAKRDKKSESAERLYLSTLLTAELERFVDGCVSVVNDYGRPYQDNQGFIKTVTTASLPKFDPMLIQANWKVLEGETMDRVFMLPYRIHQTEAMVSGYSEESVPPDFEEAFNARHFFYAKLGLSVIELVDDIRREAGLSALKRYVGVYSREECMKTAFDNHQPLFEPE